MINLTELLDKAKKKALERPDPKDGYAPKSTDELRFKKKHVVQTTDDRNGNKDDVFKATNLKTIERTKERHGYDVGKDEEVYEEAKHTCKECGEKYKGKTCPCCMKEETDKPDRLAAIAAAAKKRNAQIGKTTTSGSKGGVGGADSRRYAAGTLKNSREPEGDQLDELSKETLKSYAQKAAFPANPSTVHTPKGAKRVKGLIKATNKLYLKQYEELEKEDEQIDEAKRKKTPTEKLFNRLAKYGVKDPSSKPLVGNQHKIDANKNGKIDAEDFKMLRKEEVQVDEVLKPSMGAGAYISDFVHSKDPKFAGKSKKERMKQALAAFYAAKRGE